MPAVPFDPRRDPLWDDPAVNEAAMRLVEAERACRRETWKHDPRAFRMDNRLVGGRPYRDVHLPWQEEHIFGPMDRGQSLWAGAGRGHDRTDGCAWKLCDRAQHSDRVLRDVLVAGDRDQARIDVERADLLVRGFPDLFPDLTVTRDGIENKATGSRALVLASDAATSLGEKPTLVVMEELAAWDDKGADLKDSLLGAATKDGGCPIWVLTNAGSGKVGNWRWDFRCWFERMAQEHPGKFHFWEARGWAAEFSRAQMELLRGGMTELQARRFLDNEWLEQGESPAYPKEWVERVFDTAYRIEGREVLVEGEEKPRTIVAFVQAVDYGRLHDAAAVGTVALDDRGWTWLADDLAVAGSPEAQVSVSLVEERVKEIARRRILEATVVDPSQMVGSIQEWEAFCPEASAEEAPPSRKSKTRAYAVMYDRLKAGTFKARPDAFRRKHRGGQEFSLRRELLEGIAIEQPDGSAFFDHPKNGHNDAHTVVETAHAKLVEIPYGPVSVRFTPHPVLDRRVARRVGRGTREAAYAAAGLLRRVGR